MKIDAGWKLWIRKPSAAPAVIAASTPALRAPEVERDDRERDGADRAHARRQPVDAVGEVHDVHHRRRGRSPSARPPSRVPKSSAPRNGSVTCSTRTPESTGISAAATWPAQLDRRRQLEAVVERADERRSARAPSRMPRRLLVASGSQISAADEHAGEDRQAAEQRRAARREPALARLVDRADAHAPAARPAASAAPPRRARRGRRRARRARSSPRAHRMTARARRARPRGYDGGAALRCGYSG